MKFELLPLCEEDIPTYKKDMQEAFQRGAEAEFGATDIEILPEKDIDESLYREGAYAYKAMVDGKMVGGAIISIDKSNKHGDLELLYVKYGTQSKGVGQRIWMAVEEKHPQIEVWETITPYFEKRNLHFYINCCGFSIVEFYNSHHKDPNSTEEEGDKDELFRFEKRINNKN